MYRLIISAPVGNYLSRPWATSTLGTYTLQCRAGALLRAWRVLRTVRPWPRAGAWVNRLGLPNPGIGSLEGCQDLSGKILSVHGFCREEWIDLSRMVRRLQPLAVEANLSCPNVEQASIIALLDGCYRLQDCGLPVIAKLPPVRWMDFARPLYCAGIRAFHLCNTLPTPAGGLSGKPLKPLSLWAVQEVRQTFGESVRIIGGGGVTGPEDAREYLLAGANHVALASGLFTLRWRRRLQVIHDDMRRWVEPDYLPLASEGPQSGLANIMGQWPGDETDEQIQKGLEELS